MFRGCVLSIVLSFFGQTLFASEKYDVSIRKLRGGYSRGYDQPTKNFYYFAIGFEWQREYSGDSYSFDDFKVIGYLGKFSAETDVTMDESYLELQNPKRFLVTDEMENAYKRFVTKKTGIAPQKLNVQLRIKAYESLSWATDTYLDDGSDVGKAFRLQHENGFEADLMIKRIER